MTQCEMILEHMLEGYSITPIEALNKYKCFRLASRISDLRGAGYTIEKETVSLPGGKRCARYFMPVRKESNGQLAFV